MAKTNFLPGDKSLGTKGTKVTAAFLNAVNNHVHDDGDADGHASKIDLAHLHQSALARFVPTGCIIYTAAADAPTGFLKANGAAVAREGEYAGLFSVIGVTYGAGDGVNTFNLPDLRGEFIRSLDDGRGVDPGRALGSLQADDFKAHTHSVANGALAVNSINQRYSDQPAGSNSSGAQVTGQSGGTETRPKNIALLACIKY